MDLPRGELTLEWVHGSCDVPGFAQEARRFGYLVGPRRADAAEEQDFHLNWRVGACGAFAMNAMAFSVPAYLGMPPDFMFARWFDLIAAASATLALLVGGSYFAERSWRSLQVGVLHIDTPVTLGILAAYVGSVGGWVAGVDGLKYFDFVAMFIFLMLAGRWVQQAAVARHRRKLLRDPSLSDTVLVDGKAALVADLKPGTVFEIKPGQACPVAAELAQPSASISLEWINGESEAHERALGQALPSGALNIGTRPITLVALENWEKSTLRGLLEARRGMEKRDLCLERLLRVYLAAVVAIGVAGALWWWLVRGDMVAGLQVMISIFVVSCPCALGVAAPFADELAAARAGGLGVFVRRLGLWKKLARVRKVIFDKTGTLTLENPTLVNAAVLVKLTEQQRAAARHLVAGNLHPVSRSLFDALGPGDDTFRSCEVVEEPGQGLAFTDESGVRWSLGRPAVGSTGVDAEFRMQDQVLAGFEFRDELRAETVEEVQRLAARGMAVHVLSGDRPEKLERVARQLGLGPQHCRASLTPDEKANIVAHLDDRDTLYIGDGANDSLAFDQAACSGSPVAGRSFLEHKADFYFAGHSMRFVTQLLDTALTHRVAVRRVFTFALLYNIATVVAGLNGQLSPLAAAVLMPLSSLCTLSIAGVTFRQADPKKHRSAQDQPEPQQTEVGVLAESC
jgi:Cu2+-exporting ATPase